MTIYEQHKNKWSKCTQCSLHTSRSKVVLSRGKIPCDVLFIGEAPGVSEDVLGYPFAGPAGHLLDFIIENSFSDSRISYAMTNLVGCIPLGEDGAKTAEPPKEAIKACSPRVNEMVVMCSPQLIVRVGKLAEKWYFTNAVPVIDVLHPAAILRMDITQRGLAVQRTIIDIATALRDVSPF